MILIGIGANLEHPRFGSPRDTCEAALATLGERGVTVLARSRWYQSAPVPPSDQPWYVNAVASLESNLAPGALLAVLHAVEKDFGRARRVRNAPRVLDLDLLAHGRAVSAPGENPVLPHPRMAERAFVVLPLAELAPDWRHPVSGASAAALAERLTPASGISCIE
jgi:2-amino-4-hydroxy-6-hydroxymethyldihydropteridine diphosphokinase